MRKLIGEERLQSRLKLKCWFAVNGAIRRCHDPRDKDYHYYGMRGIVVCEEWLRGRGVFRAYIGLPPTLEHELDRIDNNGNYEPGNVRWTTKSRQARNRRVGRIVHDGKSYSIADLLDTYKIEYHRYRKRIKAGWTLNEVLGIDQPTQKNGSSLNLSQVNEIKEKRANGARVKDLAAEYAVDRTTIGNIVAGRTWATIPLAPPIDPANFD